MRSLLPAALALLFLLSTVACGARKPGPHEHERGWVTQWRVETSSVSYQGCTDAPGWQDLIELEPLTLGWFVAYRVNAEGTEAVDYDCDTHDSTTCYVNPADFSWTIDGHVLTHDRPVQVFDLNGTTCQVQYHLASTVEDQGPMAAYSLWIDLELIGDATECADVEAQIRAESSNGLGYEGCTPLSTSELSFFNAAPVD
ncbi:MAG: hypothetical protein P1V51_13920 [Deltaproteobacteria bacterium]|nr:hypothetical protein [Deltaproteobacteria bacterium]